MTSQLCYYLLPTNSNMPYTSSSLQRDMLSTRMREFWNEVDDILNEEIMPSVSSMDTFETPYSYELLIDLPGVNKEDINIIVSHHKMTIQAMKKNDHSVDRKYVQIATQERFTGDICRHVVLPRNIDDTKIIAELTNGVLSISIPKLSESDEEIKVPIL